MHLLATTIGHDLSTIGIPLADKVLRTVGVYLGLVVLLRLAGKRDLAQLNSFDLVVLLLLSNVVQNAIIGPDNSLVGGLFGAVVLLGANSLLVRLSVRVGWLGRLVQGTETTLIEHGRLDRDHIARLGLTEPEVEAAVLRQGASSVAEVARATLTPDGTIALTLEPDAVNATRGDLQALGDQVSRLDDRLGQVLARLDDRPAPT